MTDALPSIPPFTYLLSFFYSWVPFSIYLYFILVSFLFEFYLAFLDFNLCFSLSFHFVLNCIFLSPWFSRLSFLEFLHSFSTCQSSFTQFFVIFFFFFLIINSFDVYIYICMKMLYIAFFGYISCILYSALLIKLMVYPYVLCWNLRVSPV